MAIQLAGIDEKQIKDEYTKRQEAYDNELKTLQIKGEVLVRGTKAYYQNKTDIINLTAKKDMEAADEWARQERERAQGNADKLVEIEKQLADRKKAIKEKAAADGKAVQELELNDYLEFAGKGLAAINNIVGMASQTNQIQMQNELDAVKGNKEEEDKIKAKYFEKNKKTQIAQATIGMFQAAIQAYQSLSVIPVVGPFLGAAAAAAALIFGKKQIDAISAQQYQSSTTSAGGGAPSAGQNLGKNYGDGGMIEGPRHAQGGVMINAEGGEAVMTRGAVTMFGPMLSAMNQMGGGTSFSSGAIGGARPDNAARNNPAATQEPIIMKTYVVSNELTSAAEKQARLKDLSTL